MASGPQKIQARQFQAPRGTRDFYPQDMAVRRYLENVWRTTSINHGFDEIEGPTFEHLDLYTHKSGPGIVSELFSFKRAGGETEYALRPEFTPTLARMVAARAGELPRPIKWFAIPSHFRAERPQRGRLREFLQWNVDFVGDESPRADAEILACCIDALRSFGLTGNDVVIRYADRMVLQSILERVGIPSEQSNDWLLWIDKYDKLDAVHRIAEASKFGGTADQVRKVELLWSGVDPARYEVAMAKLVAQGEETLIEEVQSDAADLVRERLRPSQRRMREFQVALDSSGILDWCALDFKIVRGLAYYTGLVFEIHEATGAERAIAGGGRYDNLIESFGGPSLPACGFGMGDVVLSLVLKDKGLLKVEDYLPRPHAFVISAGDAGDAELPKLVAQLRREGFHIRHSYKSTRNVGKLLGDASKARALCAIILGKELQAQVVELKDLQSGEQTSIPRAQLSQTLKDLIAEYEHAT